MSIDESGPDGTAKVARQERLAYAQALGANVNADTTVRLAGTFRERLYQVLQTLDDEGIVAFAVSCAERSIVVWSGTIAADARPMAALIGSRRWLKGAGTSAAVLHDLSAAAGKAVVEIESELDGAIPAPELAAAMAAGNAAEHAALTAALATTTRPRSILDQPEYAASYTAAFASAAAPNYLAEITRQSDHLCHLLAEDR